MLGTAFVLGMLVSAAGLAKPVLGQNSWITYTDYNAQGQVVGESSQATCPGIQPFAWGITTNRFTCVPGTCAAVIEKHVFGRAKHAGCGSPCLAWAAATPGPRS